MTWDHIVAVFKAEYFTTTSKFREIRNWIPFGFLGGVLVFSYLLRIIFDFFRGEIEIQTPPLGDFFSIIAIFSYFTLFAPLLSPLGRVIYDGGARSRREVALSSPVKSRDLLYGNLLSNLAFFLPFFAFVGTVTLAPFVGYGNFSPGITALLLFMILCLLILIGLVTGTLISPIIFNFISAQKSASARAIVTFAVSAMLISSLPLLRFYLENVDLNGNGVGFLIYFPFSLAASGIIYILYGNEIGIPFEHAILLLIGYIIIIFAVGYLKADNLYQLEKDETNFALVNENSLANQILRRITNILPTKLASPTRSMLNASIRDIEHISRLSIGIAITIFMIFALSSRGLFRGNTSFSSNIELSVVIFALVLSAASVIFIEASSFTVQHRDMFSLIKSAPTGAKTFVHAKILQMFLLLTPIFVTMVLVLTSIGLISILNVLPLIFALFCIIFLLVTLSLAIYLVNPSDNQEDLTNFINLLIFYLISFSIAVIPVYLVIAEVAIGPLEILLISSFVLIIGYSSIMISVHALEQMNLETLDSPFSSRIHQSVKSLVLFFLGWNILPLVMIPYFLRTRDLFILLISSNLISLILPLFFLIRHRNDFIVNFQWIKSYRFILLVMTTMFLIGFLLSAIVTDTSGNLAVIDLYQTEFDLTRSKVFLLVLCAVITEELFFRYFILEYLRNEIKDNFAILWSAILFALIHIIDPISFLNALFQGSLLGWIKVKTGSVQTSILLHGIYNFTLLLLILN